MKELEEFTALSEICFLLIVEWQKNSGAMPVGFICPQRSHLCFLHCITFESDDLLVFVVKQHSLAVLSVEKQLSLIACLVHQWFVRLCCCLPAM